MNDPDSISHPVALGSPTLDPIPRLKLGSAPLSSTQLGLRLMTCLEGPTVLTCQPTSRWHGIPTVHTDTMMMSSSSKLVMWIESSSIRIGSAHLGKEDVWLAWGMSMCVGGCDHVPCQKFAHFSSLFSSLPLIHSGMVKTLFWQLFFWAKIKHHFKPYALIPIVGDFFAD
jgi:hypothetical protein